jgi:CrcB protein
LLPEGRKNQDSAKPTVRSIITAHYTGRTIDGKQFDSSRGGVPWGTMAVNVIGCFLIGLLSGLSLGGQISPTTKLVLVTGFCGGFTTFSTFMNENLLLGRDGAMLSAVLYTLLSLALGLIAVIIGYQIVK